MGRGERGEQTPILVRHAVGDVIKEQREVPAAEVQDLREPVFEPVLVRGVAVTEVQSGAEGVDEAQPAGVAGGDDLAQGGGLRRRIGFAPDCPVFQIILGRVEVGVKPPGRHPLEEFPALRQQPGPAVEALDHAGQEFRGMCLRHALVSGVLLSHKLRRRPRGWQGRL